MLLTEVYKALIDVCEDSQEKNQKTTRSRRRCWSVCTKDQRRSSKKNEMSSIPTKILLATDGSEETELATLVAVELANSTGSELHLVHVKLLPLTPPYPDVLDWRWKEELERAEREARELLDEQVKKVEDAGGTVAGVHLREELPAEEIVALAEELGTCLIVVGRRDRGRIRRVLTGSVSDWVVRHARCPVLVVGSHNDEKARVQRKQKKSTTPQAVASQRLRPHRIRPPTNWLEIDV